MAIKKNTPNVDLSALRYMLIGALVVAAFFGAYRFAQASGASANAGSTTTAQSGAVAGASTGNATGSGATAGGGGCCGGGGGSTATVAGKTTVAGGVQKVTVDLTTGSYSPNQITAKAGVPIELDFKGPASGCNGYVVSQQMGFQQDVSNGGTVKVGALKPGTYTWTCSMGMYVGQIVVQ